MSARVKQVRKHCSERRHERVLETDAWLREIFQQTSAPDVALAAVGGFGRGELAPGSDLDLVVLHAPDRSDVATIAENIWYPIWDAGKRLDHSVRTVTQARRMAADDVKVAMGLLDLRLIAGSSELVDELRNRVFGDWRANSLARLSELRSLVNDRRERFGDVSNLVEPDLKDAYGGLREVTALRAIAATWVTDTSHAEIDSAHELLLDVRDALHTVTGRSQDKLVQQEQAAVAEMLEFSDRDELSRAVSEAGRRIAYASDLTWHRVDRLYNKTPRFSARRFTRASAARLPLADGVVLQDGEVMLAESARPERDPVLVLRVAAAAAQAGLHIAPHTVDHLAQRCAPMPEPWPREAREAFVSLLGSGSSLIAVWESLDQAGIIEDLIPGWNVVRSAPQRDPIHRYTVDRHLVQTAAEAGAYTRMVSRPDLLLVGALLHDIGKARGGDHTQIGEELVAQLGPHFGFNAADTQTLVMMVRFHLLLPDVATRRDLEDPYVIETVAQQLGSRDLVELLAALAYADARATGPAAESEWRFRLIDELVSKVLAELSGAPAVGRPMLSDEQRALALGDGVEVLVRFDDPIFTITVAVDDEVGSLATQAGVLAMHRLAVRAAHTETIGSRSVSVWTTQPMYGDPPSLDLIREDIRRALDGSLDLERRLALPPQPHRTTEATFMLGASLSASVLEVRTHDAPGLLYRLGSAIASVDVVITAARVATLGSEVVDAFYLTDHDGKPLDEDRAAMVRASVLEALS